MTTPTPLADRVRMLRLGELNWTNSETLADSVAALEAENAELRTDRQHLCSELVELLAGCAVLSNSKLRHEGYEATCAERDEWKATAQAAQGALDRAHHRTDAVRDERRAAEDRIAHLEHRVSLMDETAASLALEKT